METVSIVLFVDYLGTLFFLGLIAFGLSQFHSIEERDQVRDN
jgi:hypothetical protein